MRPLRPPISRGSPRQRPAFSRSRRSRAPHVSLRRGTYLPKCGSSAPPPPPSTSVAKWLRVDRAIGVRLLAVSMRLLLPKKFSGDNRTVVARRPHGGRTLTCHHPPLLCDQTNHRQFKNQIFNARSLAFTSGYSRSSDRTNAVRLTYVYLRSLAITCRNHP